MEFIVEHSGAAPRDIKYEPLSMDGVANRVRQASLASL